MAIARSMTAREYILKCDRELPQEQQTVFLITPLSAKAQTEIEDLLSSDENAIMEIATDDRTVKMPYDAGRSEKKMRALRVGLTGWRNYKDAEGNDVPFEKFSPDERLSLLYPDWREELAEFMASLNYPDEAALKN